jgi:CoA:oxalate CoA-transferase
VAFWPLWAPTLGADEKLLADSRFDTEQSRAMHVGELVEVIDMLTSQFESFEALDAVLDPWILAAHVRSVADLAGTEWAAYRGLVAEVVPGLSVPAAPWRANGSPVGVRLGVANPGADNRSVLAEFGYDENAIAALQESGALRETLR